MSPAEFRRRVEAFTGEKPKRCRHRHELTGTGAVFFQSIGVLQCGKCGGWQPIRKPCK